ncbi:MAG TPA: hypothetical protein VFS18_05155 [Actinomycetota bacterium]|nr:hypothetical protein [Actinomycetota bacterium]
MPRPTLLERIATPFTGLSAGTFAALSRLRGKRIFHPIGEAFAGTLTFNSAADRWLPDVLARPRQHDVIVRFSRAVGLPQAFPDILGFAIKIPDLYGNGWGQDWLLVTSATDVVRRHVLIPSFGFLSRSYSSVLPYRSGETLVTFGAEPLTRRRARTFEDLENLVRNEGMRFSFTVAAEGKDHVHLGQIELTEARPQATSENLRFNPWHSSSELRPAGPLNELRRDSYVASQKARRSA